MEIKEAHVFAKGIGSGRDSALRALTSRNLNIVSIKDITPVPHNGCRIKKRRRV
jgi:small subunit ribosomal protein S11